MKHLKWLNAWRNNIQRPNSVYTLQWYCIKRTNSVYSYIQYVLCEGFPSSPFHFVCSSEFYFHPSLTVAKSIRLPLGAAESRDAWQQTRSRGGAVIFAYEMWKERNIRPQTCLHFDKCIKQCIKCIGEKNNWKYRSYQASIDPIPIPTLVSILSIFGSIRTPLIVTPPDNHAAHHSSCLNHLKHFYCYRTMKSTYIQEVT